MKVILYMATSVNGNITNGEENSDWVKKSDWEHFNKITSGSKVMVMGSVTYKQFEDDFPQKQALNIVVTNKPELLNLKIDGAIFTSKSPVEIVKMVSDMGFTQLALVGGEKLNSSFLKEDLIDEIYVDIHPLLIGKGKKLFGEIQGLFKQLKLVDVKEIGEDLILLHYRVLK